MKLIEVNYKTSSNGLLNRVIKFLVEDETTVEEVREIVTERIMSDLGVTMYEWKVKE